jgi:membrane-associated phospholipid phosphatase
MMTVVLVGAGVAMGLALEPSAARAVFDNYSERYPYSGETVRMPTLFALVVLLPCGLLGVTAVLRPHTIDLFFAYLSVAQALGITLIITEALKVGVGRPRPNYFSYAQFDPQMSELKSSRRHQRDAKVSFPSGHSSNAFASGTWLYLFMSHLTRNGHSLAHVLVRFAPIAVAVFVGATRVVDYMHHVSDVAAGAVLGIGIAAVVFHAQSARVFVPQKVAFDPLSIV